jgi:hypothetical protein
MLAESHDEEQIIARVAALDIGKAELVCCVRVPAPAGGKRRLQEVTTYSTMTKSRASRRRSGPPDAIREPNRPRAATALIDGRSGLQTCLIQCNIESASESSPYHCG